MAKILPKIEFGDRKVWGLHQPDCDLIGTDVLCRESRLAGLASKCDGMVDFVI
jgi:hypothetical protein